jgi:hypothetical protein
MTRLQTDRRPAPPDIALLKQRLRLLEGGRKPGDIERLPFDQPEIDGRLGGGLRRHALHELTGLAAPFFAAAIAGRMASLAIWISDRQADTVLFPDGFRISGLLPENTLFISAFRKDIPWVFEQAARSSAATAVIADMPRQSDFAISRRLQLAAKDAGVLALMLTSDEKAVASAAETRWRVLPRPHMDGIGFLLELTKNKSGSIDAWETVWDAATHRFHLAPAT